MPFDQVNFVLPAVETDEVLRVLIEGRAYIATPGVWVKHPGCFKEGTRCAVTACVGTPGNVTGAWTSLRNALPDGWGIVGKYNDDPDTTHADMLALFDRAIAARRAEIASSAAQTS